MTLYARFRRKLSTSFEPCLNEIIVLVEAFGFRLARVNGSHHIFVHPKVRQIVNLQEKNGKAKPYQIRQFLELVEEYDLKLGDQE